jgi:pyruvate formate lyase activating enzyme
MDQMTTATTGIVFKFQRHSLHDGPGIRTLVFLKGCPLRCLWCFNPESQKIEPEIVHYTQKCIGCNLCVNACPIPTAIEDREGVKFINRESCDNCGQCAAACPAGGMVRIGRRMGVDAVMDTIAKDKVFYDKSGGGVTLSGGEATFQADFTGMILKRCRSSGIHTAIETCGYADWASLGRIVATTDLVLYDLKIMDAKKHRRYTGVGNKIILENAKKIARSNTPMIIRIPVIPGFNDSRENLSETAAFIRDELKPVRDVHLLPYEFIGVAKYEKLSRPYALGDVIPPSPTRIEDIKKVFKEFDLDPRIGG